MSESGLQILFLVSSLNSGGAERVASVLCNAWAERGDAVTVIPTYSGGGGSFYRFHPKVQVRFLADAVKRRRLEPGYVARMRTLARMVRDAGPDVVVSFLSNVNTSAVVSAGRMGVPIVMSERSDPQHMPMSRLLRLACNLTYPRAKALVVQTKAVEAKVGRYFRLPKLVTTIPNPLPEAIGSMQCLARADAPRKTLVSVGRLSEEKQVHRMIDAFASVAAQFPQWDYAIYGDGPLRAALQMQIDRLQLSERVTLKGNTTAPWDAMAQAHAFVMASRFEGFPNALLEAMGLGLPCVVFDCESGPREISRNGQDALLVPLNDQPALAGALLQLLGDAALREQLGSRARQSVRERYGLPRVLSEWDAVFKAVGAVS
ncbi:MAG: glycosyltransferase family 4 protein [Burkholderiales bacterium]